MSIEGICTSRGASDHLYPRMKPGVKTIPSSEDEIFIGDSSSGFLLDRSRYMPIIRNCTGEFTSSQIASKIFSESSEEAIEAQTRISSILSAIDLLRSHGVLEMSELATSGHQIAKDGIYHHRRELAERLEIERSVITFRCDDGGVNEWRFRERFGIRLIGDSRIARNLLGLLTCSGFQSIAYELLPFDSHTISSKDINGLTVTAADLAKKKVNHHLEIMRLNELPLQLRDSEEGHITRPTSSQLIISTSPPTPDLLAIWQSEGIAHIAVGEASKGMIEISPIVKPGVTPCLRCIALHKRDALPPTLASLAIPDGARELPAPSAALIASFLASHIANYVERFRASSESAISEYAYRSYLINLLDPTDPIQARAWNLHPECGCVDVQRRAWPR